MVCSSHCQLSPREEQCLHPSPVPAAPRCSPPSTSLGAMTHVPASHDQSPALSRALPSLLVAWPYKCWRCGQQLASLSARSSMSMGTRCGTMSAARSCLRWDRPVWPCWCNAPGYVTGPRFLPSCCWVAASGWVLRAGLLMSKPCGRGGLQALGRPQPPSAGQLAHLPDSRAAHLPGQLHAAPRTYIRQTWVHKGA